MACYRSRCGGRGLSAGERPAIMASRQRSDKGLLGNRARTRTRENLMAIKHFAKSQSDLRKADCVTRARVRALAPEISLLRRATCLEKAGGEPAGGVRGGGDLRAAGSSGGGGAASASGAASTSDAAGGAASASGAASSTGDGGGSAAASDADAAAAASSAACSAPVPSASGNTPPSSSSSKSTMAPCSDFAFACACCHDCY